MRGERLPDYTMTTASSGGISWSAAVVTGPRIGSGYAAGTARRRALA
ncbi:hypothetical protein [Streptomyces sp. NPDC048142]